MTKAIETIELNDMDLDIVQGGFNIGMPPKGFTATDDLWKVKGVSEVGLGSGRLKMDDPKKDD